MFHSRWIHKIKPGTKTLLPKNVEPVRACVRELQQYDRPKYKSRSRISTETTLLQPPEQLSPVSLINVTSTPHRAGESELHCFSLSDTCSFCCPKLQHPYKPRCVIVFALKQPPHADHLINHTVSLNAPWRLHRRIT